LVYIFINLVINSRKDEIGVTLNSKISQIINVSKLYKIINI